MSRKIKIVLVDDDEDYLSSMTALLRVEGFEIFPFLSFLRMNEVLSEINPDILVLDVNLPSECAFDFLPSLREKKELGLIIVSGNADVDNRITGRQKGADCYFAKPVDVRELKAAILSLFQRINGNETQNWTLNHQLWTLTNPTDEITQLTESEYLFLEVLVKAQCEPVKREDIQTQLGKNTNVYDDSNLYTLLSRLRKKLDKTSLPLPVRPIRNIGYIFYEKADLVP